MNVRRGWAAAAIAVIGLSLAACVGRSPEPALYTLAPVPGTPIPGAAQHSPPTIELRRVSLAGYLDRPEIVGADTDYRLRVSHNAQWGEPLDEMIGRVLSQDLNQRLPASTVVSEIGAISPSGDIIVEINVHRLGLGPNGAVILRAQIAARDSRSSADPRIRAVEIQTRPTAGDTAAVVAAMSRAIGQLADAAAAMIRDVARHSPGA